MHIRTRLSESQVNNDSFGNVTSAILLVDNFGVKTALPQSGQRTFRWNCDTKLRTEVEAIHLKHILVVPSEGLPGSTTHHVPAAQAMRNDSMPSLPGHYLYAKKVWRLGVLVDQYAIMLLRHEMLNRSLGYVGGIRRRQAITASDGLLFSLARIIGMRPGFKHRSERHLYSVCLCPAGQMYIR